MNLLNYLLFFSTVYLSLVFCATKIDVNPDIVFRNVDRVIDISNQLTKLNYKISLENAGSKNIESFDFILEPATKKHISFFNAEGGELLKSFFGVEEIDVTGLGDTPGWRIKLKEALKPKNILNVDIEIVLTGLVTPYPEEIKQKDKQFVQYFGNHYVYSMYKVTSQKTTLQLGTKKVESFSKLNPTSQIDTTIVYGPYKNIEPFSMHKLSVHYENNSPFLIVSQLIRSIELSHWGNIAVEESIELRHEGAKLKGSFSRYEYQKESQSGVSSVKSFRTILPAAASDVYYRDEIGNISTSHFRSLSDSVEVDLRPRFPLFGGWKTEYILGYNIPSYEYLFSSGSQYVLKIRFIDHIFDDMIIDDATVRFIFPEHSEILNIFTPFSVASLPTSSHFTYLDTNGRPVISLKKRNLVESHIQDVEIEYKFSSTFLLKEPLLVSCALFILFFVVMICVRLDFSLVKPSKVKSS